MEIATFGTEATRFCNCVEECYGKSHVASISIFSAVIYSF